MVIRNAMAAIDSAVAIAVQASPCARMAIESAVVIPSSFTVRANAAHHGAHAHRQRAFDQHVVSWPQLLAQALHDLVVTARFEHLLWSEPRGTRFGSRCLRARPVHDQQVQDRRRTVADTAVARLLLATQLE